MRKCLRRLRPREGLSYKWFPDFQLTGSKPPEDKNSYLRDGSLAEVTAAPAMPGLGAEADVIAEPTEVSQPGSCAASSRNIEPITKPVSTLAGNLNVRPGIDAIAPARL